MALDVAIVAEVRQTGIDTNSGGFTLGASIAAPSAPSVSNSGSGGTVAANTYYCVITYTDIWGNTVISGQTTTTTTGTTSTITVTSPAASTGALTWSVYFGTTSGGPYFPQGTGLTIGSNRTVTSTPPTTGTQPNGVDYSQQDSPQINVSDGVANGTTTFTSATAGFTGAHVGNLARVGSANWRRIVGLTNSTTITLDTSVTTNTALPVVVGGAFLTPGMFGLISPAAGSILFQKYSSTLYAMSASSNVSGGCLALGVKFYWIGYNTTRTIENNDALRPTTKPSANSVTMNTNFTSWVRVNNIALTNPDSRTSCTAFSGSGAIVIRNTQVNGLTTFYNGNANSNVAFCDISVTNDMVFGGNDHVMFCDIHGGGSVQLGQCAQLSFCNLYNILGQSLKWVIQCNGAGVFVNNNNIYGSTRTGASYLTAIQLNEACLVFNNVIENISPSDSAPGYIFDAPFNAGDTRDIAPQCFNNFYYNVKTAVLRPAALSAGNLGPITLLTASPFTAPGSGDLSLNNIAGGGAVVRTASLPTTFPAGTTANYLDGGAAQHQASAGGGMLVHTGMTGGMRG